MGDVLTQSQIDALLSSVQQSGNFDNVGETEKSEETSQNFRKYNFHTPKKFTKDRLKLLRSVYENYGRLISSHLTSLLRLGCELELIEIEEQRYYEFNNALADDNLLAFVTVKIADNKEFEEEPVLIVMSDTVIYTMLDRMLGGTGDNPIDPDDDDGRSIHTDIEIAVYETILKYVAPSMDAVWENYLSIQFEYQKVESNPNLIQVMPIDEIVVIIVFNVTVKETSGQMSICLPGGALDMIFKQFEQVSMAGSRKREMQTQQEKASIMKGIEDSILEVKAEFEQSTVLMEELYAMNVGDILRLDLPKDSEINVNIGGKPWYKGRLGVYKENVAVKLTGIYKEQLSKSAEGEEEDE